MGLPTPTPPERAFRPRDEMPAGGALESTSMETSEGTGQAPARSATIALGKALTLLEFYFLQSWETLGTSEGFLNCDHGPLSTMGGDFGATLVSNHTESQRESDS